MTQDLYYRVFPLYMSALERFMLADDRKSYPMCFVIAMLFKGQLQREPFEMAVREALDRHRLLQSLIENAKRGRPCWVHHPELHPFFSWDEEGVPLESPQGDYIDLRHEIGLRIWVRQGPEKVEITFYFHHSCADGIAAHRFMADCMAIYTNQVCDEKPAKLIELNTEGLKTRGRRQQLAGQSDEHPHTTAYALKYLWKMSILGTDAIRTPRRKYSREHLTGRFGVAVYRLDKEQYKELRDATVKLGVTVNDLLLAQMFKTMFDWNERFRKFGRRREVRILMPVDMRTPADDVLPAADMASYNFVTRHPKHFKEPVDFVKGIRSETLAIKGRGMGSAFVNAITRATFVPGMLKLSVPGFRCTATIVLSNVGDPTRRWTASLPRKQGQAIAGNGDLFLEDLYGVPPLRPGTRVSIAITTYMRGLTVSLRCDPHYFDTDQTKEMIDDFMEGLRNWISTANEGAANEGAANEGAANEGAEE